MKEITLINTGLSNIDSVARAIQHVGGTAKVTDDPADLATAGLVLLPGVGASAPAMAMLNKSGFADAIREVVKKGTPLLGICLGMQLLATRSFEDGETACLGLIPGDVVKLVPEQADERVPHMGWNVVSARDDAVLFYGVARDVDFYFAHSYHFSCADKYVQAHTPYCGNVVTSVRKDNVFGAQFHPEKSHGGGLAVLKNFLKL